MRKWMGAAAATCAVLSISACGGEPEGCLPVSQDVAQAIVDGANGSGLTISSSGQGIARDSGVYYVAFKVTAAGADEVAVWAVDSLTAPTGISSVDGYAQRFTDWPTLEGANGSQPARDAAACLG